MSLSDMCHGSLITFLYRQKIKQHKQALPCSFHKLFLLFHEIVLFYLLSYVHFIREKNYLQYTLYQCILSSRRIIPCSGWLVEYFYFDNIHFDGVKWRCIWKWGECMNVMWNVWNDNWYYFLCMQWCYMFVEVMWVGMTHRSKNHRDMHAWAISFKC